MSSNSFSRAAAIVVVVLLSGCQSAQQGFANNSAGRAANHRFCTAVLSFVRAPVDISGLRRAWFLPFGYNDESFDFYAPMKADPSDELALAFYNDGGAQLTHYVRAPAYAKTFSSCLTKQEGFTRVVWRPGGKVFHAELKEATSERRVVVRAKGDTTAILVASDLWNGDIGQAMSNDQKK